MVEKNWFPAGSQSVLFGEDNMLNDYGRKNLEQSSLMLDDIINFESICIYSNRFDDNPCTIYFDLTYSKSHSSS